MKKNKWVSRGLKIVAFFLLANCLAYGIVYARPTYSYLKHRIKSTDKRHRTFVQAIQLMNERRAKTIVETGTSRNGACNCAGDGCATIIFSDWAKHNNAEVYSVDIDPQALQNAKNAIPAANKDCVHFVESDSVAFLQNFGKEIDFLYLDSYDFDFDNPLPSQLHHIKEIQAATPWLTKNSVIMIDDCGYILYGGKGKLVIDYLLSLTAQDWKIYSSGYQVILVRNDHSE